MASTAPCRILTLRRLRIVAEFVDAHLDEALSVSQMAGLLRLSPGFFIRAFKAGTGLTPHQFVLQRRIDRARRLLENGRAGIAEIASLCGFASQAHLTAVFARLVGTTPAAYKMARKRR